MWTVFSEDFNNFFCYTFYYQPLVNTRIYCVQYTIQCIYSPRQFGTSINFNQILFKFYRYYQILLISIDRRSTVFAWNNSNFLKKCFKNLSTFYLFDIVVDGQTLVNTGRRDVFEVRGFVYHVNQCCVKCGINFSSLNWYLSGVFYRISRYFVNNFS